MMISLGVLKEKEEKQKGLFERGYNCELSWQIPIVHPSEDAKKLVNIYTNLECNEELKADAIK